MDAESERQFREFVDARSLALRRTAYALTGDLHRAEDLVQAALVKLAGRWRKVDDPEAYTRRIIYHDQVSWWRRRARINETSVPVTPDRAEADRTDHVDRRLDVQQALLRLAPRQRAVVLLRFYEDLPEREIANVLDCTVGTVRKHLARALARLRAIAPELDPTSAPNPLTSRKAPV